MRPLTMLSLFVWTVGTTGGCSGGAPLEEPSSAVPVAPAIRLSELNRAMAAQRILAVSPWEWTTPRTRWARQQTPAWAMRLEPRDYLLGAYRHRPNATAGLEYVVQGDERKLLLHIYVRDAQAIELDRAELDSGERLPFELRWTRRTRDPKCRVCVTLSEAIIDRILKCDLAKPHRPFTITLAGKTQSYSCALPRFAIQRLMEAVAESESRPEIDPEPRRLSPSLEELAASVPEEAGAVR